MTGKKKLIIGVSLLTCTVLLCAGIIVSYCNIRQLAYGDTAPAIYIYENSSSEKVLKFFDEHVNLASLEASFMMALRSLSNYLSQHLDSFVEWCKGIGQRLNV